MGPYVEKSGTGFPVPNESAFLTIMPSELGP